VRRVAIVLPETTPRSATFRRVRRMTRSVNVTRRRVRATHSASPPTPFGAASPGLATQSVFICSRFHVVRRRPRDAPDAPRLADSSVSRVDLPTQLPVSVARYECNFRRRPSIRHRTSQCSSLNVTAVTQNGRQFQSRPHDFGCPVQALLLCGHYTSSQHTRRLRRGKEGTCPLDVKVGARHGFAPLQSLGDRL